MAGKIKSYPILNAPLKRSIQFQIPMQWLKDMQLNEGDSIDLYRDEEDRLILIANKKESHKFIEEQGKKEEAPCV
jgi:bifunctional DNA-binding transcriptional regulator/antitoxin component of YhaV-PrlF toxin-antitoxin module